MVPCYRDNHRNGEGRQRGFVPFPPDFVGDSNAEERGGHRGGSIKFLVRSPLSRVLTKSCMNCFKSPVCLSFGKMGGEKRERGDEYLFVDVLV